MTIYIPLFVGATSSSTLITLAWLVGIIAGIIIFRLIFAFFSSIGFGSSKLDNELYQHIEDET